MVYDIFLSSEDTMGFLIIFVLWLPLALAIGASVFFPTVEEDDVERKRLSDISSYL